MRIRSLRTRILLLLCFLSIPVFFVVFNLYVAQLRSEYGRLGLALEIAERNFLELVLEESQLLVDQNAEPSLKGYKEVARQLSSFDKAIGSELLERREQVEHLVTAQLQRRRHLQDAQERLLEMTSSVRYIHEHHFIYLKNFLQRGHVRADYDLAENFSRSENESASEVDIIRAAIDIHNAVLELLRFFQEVRNGEGVSTSELVFKEKNNDLIKAVNAFEDYSLDAQDGLLVEDLLVNGHYLDLDYSAAMQSYFIVAKLEDSLEHNLSSVLSGISRIRTDIAAKHERNSHIFISFQVLSILLTFLATAAIASNAFKFITRLRAIVTESLQIQEDLSHRIVVDDSVSKEFSVVFHALNDLASRVDGQVEELTVAQHVLEQKVEERTSELKQSNLSLLNEIHERHQVATALQKSEQLYRSLFENTTDIIQSIDGQSRHFMLVNPAWCKKLGYTYSESRQMVFDKIIPSAQQLQWTAFFSALDDDAAKYVEGVLIAKDGRELQVEGVATRTEEEGRAAYHFFLHDITERQLAEAERLRMQKLDSVGLLAGGIAHDFNNLLSAVVGNLNLAALACPKEGSLYKRLKEAETAAYQASDLTRQLLTFAKGGEPIRELADLRMMLQDSAEFVLRGSNVRCDFTIPEDLWPLQADSGQLSQVIQNLVINADQAMPDGGVISISASNIAAEETTGFSAAGQPHICISVIDQGIGIAPEELTHIFDPYFSTKESGHGLGLASAHSIIRKHDGWISVSSTPGLGSHFDIFLPAEPTETITTKEHQEQFSSGDGSRILVMDDEQSVRYIMTEILELNGYQVKATANGQEALECYAEHMVTGQPFDLVITDLTVPGAMGGKELAQRLHDIEAQLPILVTSGYSNDPTLANYEDYGFCGFISKPFRAYTIMDAVSNALAGASD